MSASRLLGIVGAALTTTLLTSPNLRADEGQWMPEQISQLDQAALRRMGLQLRPEELWNPTTERIEGVMGAVVNLSGCSASFVSETGLVATNHHCAHRGIQKASDVEHDYLRDGFLARARIEELPAEGATALVLERVTEVTDSILGVIAATADPLTRVTSVEAAKNQLVADCEAATPHRRCQVASFYNDSRHQLLQYLELEDLRIVYAPPSGIGNYGGEIDNWMWPRHSGDFTLLRAYVDPHGEPAPYHPDNVAFHPATFLPISTDGVGPGAFVAVLGFPGNTDRYLPAAEVRRRIEQSLPARADLYGAWIRILEDHGARDPAVHIKVAASLRGFANREKNARGMLEGAGRIGIVKRRETEEDALNAWAENQSDAKFTGVLTRLRELARIRSERFDHAFLVGAAPRASKALANAIDLVRWVKEHRKPDIEREPAYMDRNRKRLEVAIAGRTKDFEPAVDRAMMSAWLERVEAVSPASRPPFRDAPTFARMLEGTRVVDPAGARAMFESADWEAIQASRDPLIEWARELVEATEAVERAERIHDGEMLVLGPLYFEMIEGVRNGPVYPDANGTLRWSYATVEGYRPKDGLLAVPQTTVGGALNKHTGAPPFEMPERVRAAAARASASPFADAQLGDVPVCALTTADTTGGNSGSPVIDGRGRLVGLNFDRVWENVAGDFGYSADRSRNIIVDVRYLLWLLAEVEYAHGLLRELGIDPAAGARTAPRAEPTAAADIGVSLRTPAGEDVANAGCACRAESNRGALDVAWLALLVVAARTRRSTRSRRAVTRA